LNPDDTTPRLQIVDACEWDRCGFFGSFVSNRAKEWLEARRIFSVEFRASPLNPEGAKAGFGSQK
jgi:hypothetical protein